jgi:hypothetical protein
MRLDLAVPEAPAALLVGGGETVLRPGSIQRLAVSLQDFRGDGGLVLPASYGVEVAPLLFLPRFDARAYDALGPLARLRVSVATRRGEEEGTATALAAGLRTSLHDGSDLRTSERYRDEITPYLTRIGELEDSIRFAPLAQCLPNMPPPCEAVPPMPEQAAARIEAYRAEQLLLADSLESLRARWVAALWNAPRFDVAFATAQEAADSTGRDPRPAAYALWAGYSNGLGTSWANLVLGGRLRWGREDDWARALSGGARHYVGRNLAKGFVEAGYGDGSGRVLGGGGELKLYGGVFATLFAGWETDADGRARLRARFNLRTSPENAAG